MKAWFAPVWLVTGRELSERSRTRTFRFVLVFLVLLGVALVLVPKILGNRTRELTFGVLGDPPAGLGAALDAGRSGLGVDTVQVRSFGDEASLESAVRGGSVDAGLRDVLAPSGAILVVEEDASPTVLGLANSAVVAVRLQAGLAAAGVDPTGSTAALLTPRPVQTQVLDPAAAEQRKNAVVGFWASLVLYLALLTAGTQVATGVAEEKTSRIAEVLLATLRPTQLLTGKVLGIGLLGLAQVLAVGLPVLVLGFGFGAVSLPSGALPAILAALGWFVLGFAIYASAYGALGALVARPEEVSSAVTPLTIVIVIGYFAAVAGLQDPNAPIVRLASLVPFFAPMVMPLRIAAGVATVPEVLVSVALAALTAAVLVKVGAVVYGRAIFATGGRLSLRAVLTNRPS